MTESKKYVILALDDAKVLAQTSSCGLSVVDRLRVETGADIEEIAALLKALTTCLACEVEGQETYCVCWQAHKLGRRLSRLIDRANA
jgi:hypothetical protein